MSTTETETGAQEAAELANEAQEAAEGAQEGSPESQALSVEDARKLRSEARNLRARLKEAEAKEAERQKAEMSEAERLKADIADRDEKLTAAQRELRFLRAQTTATDLGFIDPEVAEKFIDWDEIEDPSDVRQVKAALRDVLKRKPHLAHARDGVDGGAGRDQTGRQTDMNDLIRAGAGRR